MRFLEDQICTLVGAISGMLLKIQMIEVEAAILLWFDAVHPAIAGRRSPILAIQVMKSRDVNANSHITASLLQLSFYFSPLPFSWMRRSSCPVLPSPSIKRREVAPGRSLRCMAVGTAWKADRDHQEEWLSYWDPQQLAAQAGRNRQGSWMSSSPEFREPLPQPFLCIGFMNFAPVPKNRKDQYKPCLVPVGFRHLSTVEYSTGLKIKILSPNLKTNRNSLCI